MSVVASGLRLSAADSARARSRRCGTSPRHHRRPVCPAGFAPVPECCTGDRLGHLQLRRQHLLERVERVPMREQYHGPVALDQLLDQLLRHLGAAALQVVAVGVEGDRIDVAREAYMARRVSRAASRRSRAGPSASAAPRTTEPPRRSRTHRTAAIAPMPTRVMRRSAPSRPRHEVAQRQAQDTGTRAGCTSAACTRTSRRRTRTTARPAARSPAGRARCDAVRRRRSAGVGETRTARPSPAEARRARSASSTRPAAGGRTAGGTAGRCVPRRSSPGTPARAGRWRRTTAG